MSFLHNEFSIFVSSGNSTEILEYTHEIRVLFSIAKIQDRSISFMEPIGLGYGRERKINFLENMFVLNSEITPAVNQFFIEAKGYFKYHMLQSINPLYWIDVVVFLPKYFIRFLNMDENRKYARFLTVAYWLLTFIIFIYEEEIRQIFRKFLEF